MSDQEPRCCPTCESNDKTSEWWGGIRPITGDVYKIGVGHYCDDHWHSAPATPASESSGQRPDAAPRDHVGDSTGGITKDGKVRGGGEFPICATCGEKVTTSWEAHADECEGEDFGADVAPAPQEHTSSHEFEDAVVCVTCNAVFFDEKWHQLDAARENASLRQENSLKDSMLRAKDIAASKVIDQLQAQIARLEEALRHARSTVRFFSSVIKSGERWSVTCQEALEQVQKDCAALAEQPKEKE